MRCSHPTGHPLALGSRRPLDSPLPRPSPLAPSFSFDNWPTSVATPSFDTDTESTSYVHEHSSFPNSISGENDTWRGRDPRSFLHPDESNASNNSIYGTSAQSRSDMSTSMQRSPAASHVSVSSIRRPILDMMRQHPRIDLRSSPGSFPFPPVSDSRSTSPTSNPSSNHIVPLAPIIGDDPGASNEEASRQTPVLTPSDPSSSFSVDIPIREPAAATSQTTLGDLSTAPSNMSSSATLNFAIESPATLDSSVDLFERPVSVSSRRSRRSVRPSEPEATRATISLDIPTHHETPDLRPLSISQPRLSEPAADVVPPLVTGMFSRPTALQRHYAASEFSVQSSVPLPIAPLVDQVQRASQFLGSALICGFCNKWLRQRLTTVEGSNPSHAASGRRRKHYALKPMGCPTCKFLEESITLRLRNDRLEPGQVEKVAFHGPYPLNELRESMNVRGMSKRLTNGSGIKPHVLEIDENDSSQRTLCAIMEVAITTVDKRNITFMIQFQAFFRERTFVEIRPWVHPIFDPGLISQWLDVCEKQDHTTRFDTSDKTPVDFRLLDLKENCVVRVARPQDARYVALSYNWASSGGANGSHTALLSNIDDLEKPGSLKRWNISNESLIGACMKLCKTLKQRYLWIDRLCIVQDDRENKAKQVQTMDVVYSCAFFTLVCSLNSKKEGGLPGWSFPRDHKRTLTQRLGKPMLSSPSSTKHIDNVVLNTRWNSRGWTFQETRLSRRCVYITDTQLFFDCTCGFAEEMRTWTGSTKNPCSHLGMTLYSGEPVNYDEYDRGSLTDETSSEHHMRTQDRILSSVMRNLSSLRRTSVPSRTNTGSSETSSSSMPITQTRFFPQALIAKISAITSTGSRSLPTTPIQTKVPFPPPADIAATPIPHDTEEPHRRFFRHQTFTFEDYSEAVEQYSKRQLTKHHDNLFAFQGVLHRLSKAYGCHDIHGLPEKFLLRSLFWRRPEKNIKRVGEHALPEIPTWAWAHRRQPLEYVEPTDVPLLREAQHMYHKTTQKSRLEYVRLDTDMPNPSESDISPSLKDAVQNLIYYDQNKLFFRAGVMDVTVREPEGSTLFYDLRDLSGRLPCQTRDLYRPANAHIKGRIQPLIVEGIHLGQVRYDSYSAMSGLKCETDWCHQHDDPADCHKFKIFLVFFQQFENVPRDASLNLVAVCRGSYEHIPGHGSAFSGERIGFAEISGNVGIDLVAGYTKLMPVILG